MCTGKRSLLMHRKFNHYLIFLLLIASGPVFAHLSVQEDRNLEAQLLRLLPKQGEPSNWRMVSGPRFFGPDNLYDYIDGAADLFLLYGFRKVITAEYIVASDSSTVNVEIYCMKSPVHAFGIYAAERSPKVRSIALGVQGYLAANALVFYKGPYYIKITTFALIKDLNTSLLEMGRSTDDKIPGNYQEPEMFHYFPEENRVRCSERFIPVDFLGQSYLQNGYRCDYATIQDTFQIFLVPLDSDTTARLALMRYGRFLESQKYSILPQSDEKVVIAEKELFILAFTHRSYFGGVLDIKNLKEGQSFVETMREKLPDE